MRQELWEIYDNKIADYGSVKVRMEVVMHSVLPVSNKVLHQRLPLLLDDDLDDRLAHLLPEAILQVNWVWVSVRFHQRPQ